MKVRLTLIAAVQNIQKNFDNEDFFKFLVTDNQFLPFRYISTKKEDETLKDLFEEYLNVHFDWATFNLEDFRKLLVDECEVVYSCKLPPMFGIEKKGKFVSHKDNIDLEDFYGRILSRKFRLF